MIKKCTSELSGMHGKLQKTQVVHTTGPGLSCTWSEQMWFIIDNVLRWFTLVTHKNNYDKTNLVKFYLDNLYIFQMFTEVNNHVYYLSRYLYYKFCFVFASG